jgi:hypothetical protein
MGAIYELELEIGQDGERLTPTFLFSFEELGRLAAGGRVEAIGKLFRVVGAADGVVAEVVCDAAINTLANYPAGSVDQLRFLELSARQQVYGCFDLASAERASIVQNAVRGIAERGEPVIRAIATEILAELAAR